LLGFSSAIYDVVVDEIYPSLSEKPGSGSKGIFDKPIMVWVTFPPEP
jgi:hypothetical protein